MTDIQSSGTAGRQEFDQKVNGAPEATSQQNCAENKLNIAELRNKSSTGSDLWCYQCEELYKKTYDPYASPCLNNVSSVVIRQCDATDRFCKVERLDILKFGRVQQMFRGCTKNCYYGCRFYGYGLSYMKCTSCCSSYGCNSDNGQSKAIIGHWLIQVAIVVSLSVCNRFSFLQ
ncbi:hypothetical protein CAPTEDRAFT_212316 [Capitella teleta]|uniref:Snake toxin/toxin-like domain-containing protein n=1 Tax=Capitella teleta TaxID=283909 RepID=R7TDI9_CAPTE|nr:hypothetical protein CAPTEDRAFT_212316 [Capitella teleta]|eukprot:ELT89557.1 hypothetical protein CAPTEDRAFT_212316 [Capitella teleta]